MMKYAVLLFAIVAIGQCQRPPYAASRPYPDVLPRFRDETTSTTTTTTTPASTSETPSATGVGNRVGEESNSVNSPPLGIIPGSPVNNAPVAAGAGAAIPTTSSTTQSPSTTSTTPRDLPVHALGDAGFVDRIQTWPEGSQPFWYLNRQQIDQHLHPSSQQGVVRPGAQSASFFAGRK